MTSIEFVEGVRFGAGRSVRAGGAHVDLGAETQMGRPAVAVEIEDHPLALSDHPEDRAFESVGGEVVVGEIGVAHDDAERGDRIVSLDDALHECGG